MHIHECVHTNGDDGEHKKQGGSSMKVAADCKIMGKQHCAQTQNKEMWFHTQDCLPKTIKSLTSRKSDPTVRALHSIGKARLALPWPSASSRNHFNIPDSPHLFGNGQRGTRGIWKARGFEKPGCTPCLCHRPQRKGSS